MIRSYNELIYLPTFEERFEYLDLHGVIGNTTFNNHRWLNQAFYHSKEWRRVRDIVIVRDKACDLGIEDREIYGPILIHHINPITIEDLELGDYCVFDLNNLICVSKETHNAIHFGNKDQLITLSKNRSKGDTSLW